MSILLYLISDVSMASPLRLKVDSEVYEMGLSRRPLCSDFYLKPFGEELCSLRLLTQGVPRRPVATIRQLQKEKVSGPIPLSYITWYGMEIPLWLGGLVEAGFDVMTMTAMAIGSRGTVSQGRSSLSMRTQPSRVRPYYSTPIRVSERLVSRWEKAPGFSQKPIEVDIPPRKDIGRSDVRIIPALMREGGAVQAEGLQKVESTKIVPFPQLEKKAKERGLTKVPFHLPSLFFSPSPLPSSLPPFMPGRSVSADIAILPGVRQMIMDLPSVDQGLLIKEPGNREDPFKLPAGEEPLTMPVGDVPIPRETFLTASDSEELEKLKDAFCRLMITLGQRKEDESVNQNIEEMAKKAKEANLEQRQVLLMNEAISHGLSRTTYYPYGDDNSIGRYIAKEYYRSKSTSFSDCRNLIMYQLETLIMAAEAELPPHQVEFIFEQVLKSLDLQTSSVLPFIYLNVGLEKGTTRGHSPARIQHHIEERIMELKRERWWPTEGMSALIRREAEKWMRANIAVIKQDGKVTTYSKKRREMRQIYAKLSNRQLLQRASSYRSKYFEELQNKEIKDSKMLRYYDTMKSLDEEDLNWIQDHKGPDWVWIYTPQPWARALADELERRGYRNRSHDFLEAHKEFKAFRYYHHHQFSLPPEFWEDGG